MDRDGTAAPGKSSTHRVLWTGELPEEYRPLLEWYWTEYNRERRISPEDDPILALQGVGKELWQRLGGVKFIEELRRGWQRNDDPETRP